MSKDKTALWSTEHFKAVTQGEYSTIGIQTGYELDDRVQNSSPGIGDIFSCPRRPDRTWGPPGLLSSG
jgi:hypothetical protein